MNTTHTLAALMATNHLLPVKLMTLLLALNGKMEPRLSSKSLKPRN